MPGEQQDINNPAPDTGTSIRLAWFGMLIGQGFYLVLAWWSAEQINLGLAHVTALPYALGGAAAIAGLLSHRLWRKAGVERVIAAPPQIIPDALIRKRLLIAWSLDDGVAMTGLMLALLGFTHQTWLIFNVAGCGLLLLHRPPTHA